ncbi:MAG: hypothetical protein ACKVQA_20065 [Burkholderiales bacterium]
MSTCPSVIQRLAAVVILSLGFGVASLADGIEGTWRLVKRQLPDGTIQTPPTVAGLGTLRDGIRHLNVFWRTPDGRPASVGLVSRARLVGNEYTETLIARSFDDGSGQAAAYTLSGETKTVLVKREGSRISYQLPFDAPAVVYDGDKLTATLEGVFTDYWERLK